MGRKRIITAMLSGILGACLAVGCGAGGLSASTEDLTETYRKAGGKEGGYAMAPGFSQAYLDFSLELLKQSRSRTEASGQNTLISPVSVVSALEMARGGANGETLAQISETLYAGLAPEEGRESLLAFSQLLSGGDQAKAAVKMADSVWFRTGDVFVPDEGYLTDAAAHQAKIFGAAFDEATCSDINRWVKQETDGEIDEILDEIPDDAVMYLVNAVAFEAEWETPYRKNEVRDAVFYEAQGAEQTVSMMYSEEHIFLSGAGARGVKKPYQGGYSFVALLPEEGTDFSEWLSGLSGEDFRLLLANETSLTVQTGIPKLESGTDLELSAALAELGMPLAFDEELADFSGLGSCTDGSNISISRVLHATQICVDEKGTKAGAATAVEMTKEMAALEEERVVLDRPFLYAIVEEESGLPVFLGTVESFR